jgi:hypothetical protein
MYRFSSVLTFTMLVMIIVPLLGCSKSESSKPNIKWTKLSDDDQERLSVYRSEILSEGMKRYGIKELSKTKADLPTLQRFIDDKVYLQIDLLHQEALGAAFGDVLATELGLHWEVVTDQFGTDPVLRYKATSIQIAPLTMILKRVEDGRQINLVSLFNGIDETLQQMIKSGDYQ